MTQSTGWSIDPAEAREIADNPDDYSEDDYAEALAVLTAAGWE